MNIFQDFVGKQIDLLRQNQTLLHREENISQFFCMYISYNVYKSNFLRSLLLCVSWDGLVPSNVDSHQTRIHVSGLEFGFFFDLIWEKAEEEGRLLVWLYTSDQSTGNNIVVEFASDNIS